MEDGGWRREPGATWGHIVHILSINPGVASLKKTKKTNKTNKTNVSDPLGWWNLHIPEILVLLVLLVFLVCQGYGQGGRMALEAGGWRLEAGAWSLFEDTKTSTKLRAK